MEKLVVVGLALLGVLCLGAGIALFILGIYLFVDVLTSLFT